MSTKLGDFLVSFMDCGWESVGFFKKQFNGNKFNEMLAALSRQKEIALEYVYGLMRMYDDIYGF